MRKICVALFIALWSCAVLAQTRQVVGVIARASQAGPIYGRCDISSPVIYQPTFNEELILAEFGSNVWSKVYLRDGTTGYTQTERLEKTSNRGMMTTLDPSTKKFIPLMAHSVYYWFKSNPVSAIDAIKGKAVGVFGKIISIDIHKPSGNFIVLLDGDQVGLCGVAFVVSKSQKKKVMGLSVGGWAVMSGTYVDKGLNVVMDKASVVSFAVN